MNLNHVTVNNKDILWDMSIQTDKEIRFNQLDITVKNIKEFAYASTYLSSPKELQKKTLQDYKRVFSEAT